MVGRIIATTTNVVDTIDQQVKGEAGNGGVPTTKDRGVRDSHHFGQSSLGSNLLRACRTRP